MKNSILTTISLILFSILGLHGQGIVMTVNAGVTPQINPESHYIFVNRSSPSNEFTFDLGKVKASYFIGIGAKYNVKPFFFTADAQYNRREYVYNLNYTYPGFVRSEQSQSMTESMNVINLPVSLGVDLGLVDFISGFLPQVVLSQSTGLSDLTGYSQDLKRLRLGWHSGIAVHLGAMRVGADMQMDFNNYADHANINGQSLSLQGRPTRFVGTVSYEFK